VTPAAAFRLRDTLADVLAGLVAEGVVRAAADDLGQNVPMIDVERLDPKP
jgi:hypothetical protein